MDALALAFLAHLVGDYLLQNDRMAAKKVHPNHNSMVKQLLSPEYSKKESFGWCFLHCLLYTLSVGGFLAFSAMGPLHWSLLIACFVVHFLIDHFRLARKYMALVGQEAFASGFCAPWSVFIVDNTFHILTSWILIVIQKAVFL